MGVIANTNNGFRHQHKIARIMENNPGPAAELYTIYT